MLTASRFVSSNPTEQITRSDILIFKRLIFPFLDLFISDATLLRHSRDLKVWYSQVILDLFGHLNFSIFYAQVTVWTVWGSMSYSKKILFLNFSDPNSLRHPS